jgi:hypothetical protein
MRKLSHLLKIVIFQIKEISATFMDIKTRFLCGVLSTLL